MSERSRSLVLIVLGLILLVLPVTNALGDSVFIQEGKDLYQKLCAGCHGSVNASAKAGRSMTRIRSAIRSFEPHRTLASLPDEQILLIAMALRENEN